MEFSEAIANLYRAFAKCKPYRKEFKPAYTLKLSHLSVDDLIPFILSLEHKKADQIKEWQRIDFKYFIPRLLEICAGEADFPLPGNGPYFYFRPYYLFQLFSFVHWEEWDQKQHSAIKDFMIVLWHSKLQIPIGFKSLVGYGESYQNSAIVLASFAFLYPNITPFLDVWLQDQSLYSMRHLHMALYDFPRFNRFWWSGVAQKELLYNWIKESGLKEKLTYTLNHNSELNLTEVIVAVLEIIEGD